MGRGGVKNEAIESFSLAEEERRRKEEKETERDGPVRRARRAGCAGRSGNFSRLPSITLIQELWSILDGNANAWTPVMDSDHRLRC